MLKSNIQKMVSLSTTKFEYIALTEAIKEAVWPRGTFKELGFSGDCVEVSCDSQSVIPLSKNYVYNERTNHIDIRLYFIRDMISEGVVKVFKIVTTYNPSATFSKLLSVSKL